MQESYTNSIELQEEPALVSQMIRYLYCLDYDLEKCEPGPETGTSGNSKEKTNGENASEGPSEEISNADSLGEIAQCFDPLSFHIQMYSLADRMCIEGLKHLSKDKTKKEMTKCGNHTTFEQAIWEIYKSTPTHDQPLRDMAVKVTMDNL